MTVTQSVMSRIRAIPSQIKKSQRSFDPYRVPDVAPSARLTPAEHARTARVYSALALQKIIPDRWELGELGELACGDKFKFDYISMQYASVNDWSGFE